MQTVPVFRYRLNVGFAISESRITVLSSKDCNELSEKLKIEEGVPLWYLNAKDQNWYSLL